jgi:predicted amidohydrolase
MANEHLSTKHLHEWGYLAVVQTSPRIDELHNNLEQIEASLKSLEPSKNKIVVFPEMATTGYFFDSREHLRKFAEAIPEGPTTQALVSLARAYHAYLVVGLPELQGNNIFNSAVVVGPDGYITKYRKLHLWSEEKLLYDSGDLGIVVANLPFAKVGIMICYDLWFPEQIRILRLMGADVIAVPAALVWNDTPAHVKHGYYMANYVGMTAAHLNQVYLALASQVGHFGDKWLFGSSFIAGPHGWLLEEPAGDQEPALIQSKVDFTEGKRLRGWGEMDDFDEDRRVDVYGSLLGYGE